MKNVSGWIAVGLMCLRVCHSNGAEGQDEKWATAILTRDKQFWDAYNACDTEHFNEFFTQDVEFYHDKGGVTVGLGPLVDKMKKNLCGGNGPRLRRERIPGTETLFPLRDGNEVYGAILSGEHLFYVSQDGKGESLDGRANFTDLWLKRDGAFKMARVVSFNHRPAIEQKETKLSHQQLDALAGAYKGPTQGKMSIIRDGELLVLQTEKVRFLLYPEGENRFFAKERDLTFEFKRVEGKPLKLVVREHGQISEEALRER